MREEMSLLRGLTKSDKKSFKCIRKSIGKLTLLKLTILYNMTDEELKKRKEKRRKK